ncbi:OLC1v1031103C1 [Oldenlandia corymbosa var. corymbosa]|uniref:OLC1v1031103C1 n=1 Tax=Oldenlandia corymbosa var. corymbosa TaxID=529605 RepID=A0AAV1CHR8_OLDCO|nr:OLC1v1031103C1 [Oldenlandia corymbosa var. corymbosa]
MWNDLPSDLLAQILSFLPADALACAKSVSRNWNRCPDDYLDMLECRRQCNHPPWFLPGPRELIPWHDELEIMNVAVGVVGELSMDSGQFQIRIFVVAGAENLARSKNGSGYDFTTHMYDSHSDLWAIVGPVPKKYLASLSERKIDGEGLYANGVLYWINSVGGRGRYTLIALEITTHKWKESCLPTKERICF